MGMGARVVVALPAYMAEQTLARTVEEIPAELEAEVIVVDDASRDRTAEVARQLGLTLFLHERDKGYGENQKTCYDQALREGAEVVVLLHADYQYDPKSIVRLVEPILAGRADFTFGSRFARGADPRTGGMPLYRYWGNKLTTWAENLLLGTCFTELHSGFKAYHRRTLEHLNYHAYSDDFVFDSQMVVDAVLHKLRIEEVAIPTRYTLESSSISVRRSLVYIGLTVYELFRARLKPRTRH
jgi:glycosyltransferase involved in cell wall biosynthesis